MRKRILAFFMIVLVIIQLVPSFAFAAKSDVSLTVPKEYSIDGKTSYSLTSQEYKALMVKAHDYVQDRLDKLASGFYNIGSLFVNEDCTEVTAVIWNAQLTQAETEAEKEYYDLCSIYAAYAQKKLNKLNIVYKNAIDEVLWTKTVDTGQAVESGSAGTSSAQSSSGKQNGPSQGSTSQSRSTPQNKSSGGTAWIPGSKNADCYHSKPNCGRMNPQKASKVTVEWAERNGYRRCSKCW